MTSLLILAGAAGALGCSQGAIGWAPLAQGQRGVTSMAADGSYVYWATIQGAVRRVSIDGGPVETVAEGVVAPDHLAVDGTHVYWAMNQGVIARAPKEGGALEMLAENEDDVVGLQVDDANLYWAGKSGFVRSAAKVGGQRVELAQEAGRIASLSLSGPDLVWTYDESNADDGSAASGQVRLASTSGGEVSTLDTASGLGNAVARGGFVSWASFDPDALALDPQSTSMRISRVGLDGSDERVVVSELSNIDALVADDTQIYYSTYDGAVNAVSADGGTATGLATGPSGKTSITFDTTNVYWAHANSDAIFVLPKPQTTVFQ